jgi:lysophospholipase L1-like esterase
MSVASDLARLTATIDTANELLLSDQIKMMDVGGGVMRPTNAKAIADLATQMSGALIYSTVALGLAGTIAGGHFSVLAPDAAEYLILYRNQAGVAIEEKRYPSKVALDLINRLMQGPSTLPIAAEEAALALSDEEGGEFLLITPGRTRTPSVEALTDSVDSGLYDAEGGAVIHIGADGMSLGPLMLGMTTLPGIYVTDQEDNILQRIDDPGEAPESLIPKTTDPLAGGVYFAPKLVTAPGIPLHLDVSSMIAPREDSIGVVASISSHSTAESSSSTRELIVQAAKFGPTARLKLRDPNNALTHHVMDLSMIELPVGPYPGAAPNVLGIGDSILNRQGAQFLSEALTAVGYSANFIGTMPGSASVANPNDMSGPMGEGREAYSTGNYTYADISEITIPLAPGDEAAYLAMSKVERRNRNPFIRAATGADDPAIVRNGYVLDFAFYQARFSLPTPDVIVYALGMNEFIRVTNGNDLYAYMLDNEKLMMQRIRAAWPDVKILRCLPGLPFQKTRNPQWTDRYIPMIRGVMTNLNDLANPKNTLVPSWTFANPETGYATGNNVVDPVTGIHQVEITDNTHPIGANRRRLYQGIAPYIAAAQLNLI